MGRKPTKENKSIYLISGAELQLTDEQSGIINCRRRWSDQS